jgi:hypothetical protein
MWWLACVAVLTSGTGSYRVYLERAADPAYRPAAERLAALHGAEVVTFEPADLAALGAALKAAPVRHAAFVVRPATIDAQWAQDLLLRLTEVDDDPFLDVGYAFITGRDGAAAERFVGRIEEAGKRPFGDRAALFGTWEGPVLPPAQPLSALAALGLRGEERFVLSRSAKEERSAATRAALTAMAEADLLLFFSHGEPDRMEGCYSARDLAAWQVRFAPSLLIQCACWNGSTGRWWMDQGAGPVERPAPAAEDSVALAVLDTGVAGYVAGVDPWHGPLAMRCTARLLDRGLSLGEMVADNAARLALEFAPGRIDLPPVAQRAPRQEGVANRRQNAMALIVFGDPAWAPFGGRAPRRQRASVGVADGVTSISIDLAPLVQGLPGQDFMLPSGALGDYFSVRSAAWAKEAALELVDVVPWPAGTPAPRLRVTEAKLGTAGQAIPTGPPQALLESTPDGPRLHVRVPLTVPSIGSPWPMALAAQGATIRLAAE